MNVTYLKKGGIFTLNKNLDANNGLGFYLKECKGIHYKFGEGCYAMYKNIADTHTYYFVKFIGINSLVVFWYGDGKDGKRKIFWTDELSPKNEFSKPKKGGVK